MTCRTLRLSLFAGLLMAGQALAADGAPDARAELVAQLLRTEAESLVSDPTILTALRTSNGAHAGLSPADIQALDARWIAEKAAGGGPLVQGLLDAPASLTLIRRKDLSAGLIADLFIFDSHGLNVAQTWVTTDYFQGDEAQFLTTVPNGPGAVTVEPPETDPATGEPWRAGSATLTDPATGAPLGAVTVIYRARHLDRRR